MNKLFETLNNRGIQLAQHEILKASLLGKIQNKKRRYRYGVLWNACCDMENYIERSLALEIGSFKSVADTFDRWVKKHDWAKIENLLKGREVSKMNKLSLEDIVKKCQDTGKEKVESGRIDENDFAHPDAGSDEFEPVRSILSFRCCYCIRYGYFYTIEARRIL